MLKSISFSVFSKMSIFFIILIIIMLLFGSVLYHLVEKTVLNQLNDSINYQITNYFDILEEEFIRVEQMQLDALHTSDLQELLYKDTDSFDYETSQIMNRIIDKLSIIDNSCQYIELSSIYLPHFKIKLNSSGRYPSYSDITASNTDDRYSGFNHKEMSIENTLNFGIDNTNVDIKIESVFSRHEIVNSAMKYSFSEESVSYFVFSDGQALSMESFEGINIDFKEYVDISDEIIEVTINNVDYMLFTYDSQYIGAQYFQFIPKNEIVSSINALQIYFWVFGVVAIFITVIHILNMFYLFKKPMNVLVKSFKTVGKNNFKLTIEHNNKDEFSYVYNEFNKMTSKIDTLVSQVYLQKILNQKAQLRQLQSQINPHFFYNNFFILKNRIEQGKNNGAKEFCEMLGIYYRYITKNDNDQATIYDEFEHAKMYINIQKVRFVDNVLIDVQELPLHFNDISVPKMIIQPIIENSFKYALEKKEFDGILKISFKENEEYIYIIIEDNGEDIQNDPSILEDLKNKLMTQETNVEASGLINIKKRINIFSEKNGDLSVSQSDLGGLRVVLKIHKEVEYG